MTRFVLDCSVTMSWYFEDDPTGYAIQVLEMLDSSEAVVPWIWTLEVANVLLVAERRRGLGEAESTRFLELLSGLPVHVEDTQPAKVLHDTLSLGRQHRLTAYDASYLELAMREGLPIATLDDRLRQACEAAGVRILTG